MLTDDRAARQEPMLDLHWYLRLCETIKSPAYGLRSCRLTFSRFALLLFVWVDPAPILVFN